MAGAYDLQISLQQAKVGAILLCGPDYLAPVTILDIVLKFMREQPELRIAPTVTLTMAAMVKAYPCR